MNATQSPLKKKKKETLAGNELSNILQNPCIREKSHHHHHVYLLNQFLLKTYVDQECVTLIDRSCSYGGNVCILLSTSSVMPHEEDSHSVWFCRPLLCSIGLGVIELNTVSYTHLRAHET